MRGIGLDRETQRVDDGRIGREGLGGGHLLEPLRDHGRPTTVVLLIEPAHGGGARPLNRPERRPRLQKVTALPGGELADPVEGLREVLLEEARESVGQGDPVLDELPAVFAEQLQPVGLHGVGHPRAELGTMSAQQVHQKCGIGRVALAPLGWRVSR